MIQGDNDPVMAELKRRGVPSSNDNYNRMSAAMKGSGWSGGSAPTGNIKPMALSGQMPDDMQYGAEQPEQEMEQGPAPDQYGAEMSEADSYLDQIAGKPQQPMGNKLQGSNMSKTVAPDPTASVGAQNMTPQPALNSGGDHVEAVPEAESGSNWIESLLTALLGGGAAAGAAKMFGNAPGGAVSAKGAMPPQQLALPAPEQQLALPAPGGSSGGDPRAIMIEQEMQQMLPAPQKQLEKPRHKVRAGRRAVNNEPIALPDESGNSEFEKKSSDGYQKAKLEGRLGRQTNAARAEKLKSEQKSSKTDASKTKAKDRKAALLALRNKAARK